MSILLMARVWAAELEPVEKLVALCFADFANDEGQAYPSLKTVAKKSGLSEATVRRKLRNLIDRDLLTLTPRKDKSGRDTSALVKLNLGTVAGGGCQPARVAACQGSTVTGGGCHGDTLILEPSMNHKIMFNEFYEAYPKKRGRAAAQKAFTKIKPSADLFESIMTALKQQKDQSEWLRNGGQFVPMPATWLNGRRWEDELAPTKASPPANVTTDSGVSADYLREAGLIL